jgi:Cof subfamily protein (haloacid dehalogenase superfamily)
VGEDALLHPRTREAIGAARAAGLRVLVVTGRMFQSVRPYVREAGLSDPVICYQGALVADPTTGEFLRHVPIPLREAREAIAEIDRRGYPLNCYVDDELYVAHMNPQAERYARFQNLTVHEVGPLLEWLDREPTKLVVVEDPHVLDGLEAELKDVFDGRLYISKSLPYFLELASPAVTKGSGLAFLSARLGFTPQETVAFGDGENDIELLEWAGYGVAMANGHERVKTIADWICPPVWEEGVAQAIEALLARRS